MPARGRHRRPRQRRFPRLSPGFLILTASGAGIALPLVAAGGASATQPTAATPATASATVSAAAPSTAPSTVSYTVASGDTLVKIARKKDVDGGWRAVYDGNREVIGDNPGLILPGQKLTLETATTVEAAPAAAGYTAPVPAAVSTGYAVAGAMWSSGYHTGADFSVGTGTSVVAVAPGEVVSSGYAGAYGNEVVILHDDGYYSQYAHLSSLSVSAGQRVGAGQEIGLSGSTGNSTGPHLHFEVRTGPGYGSDIDPLAYLRSQGVTV